MTILNRLFLFSASVSFAIGILLNASSGQSHVEIPDDASAFSATNFQVDRDFINKETLQSLPFAIECGSTRLEIVDGDATSQVFLDKKTRTRVLVDLSDKNQIEAYSFSKSELTALKRGERKKISATEIAGFFSSDGGHLSTSDRSCTLAEPFHSASTSNLSINSSSKSPERAPLKGMDESTGETNGVLAN